MSTIDETECPRCGSSAAWEDCENCGGEGTDGHECGEDSCSCAFPEDNLVCEICNGTGSYAVCLSSADWCQSHPLPGRENVARAA